MSRGEKQRNRGKETSFGCDRGRSTSFPTVYRAHHVGGGGAGLALPGSWGWMGQVTFSISRCHLLSTYYGVDTVQSASHEFFSSSLQACKRKLKLREDPSPAAALGISSPEVADGAGALARGSGVGYTSWLCGLCKSISLPWPQFPCQVIIPQMGIITSVGGTNESTHGSVLCETLDTCQELVTLRANIYLSPARG